MVDPADGDNRPVGQFAYLVQEVKADKAINLDGGVSAQMTVCLGHLNRVAIQGERGTINSVVGHRKLKYAE